MRQAKTSNKTILAKELDISRSGLYYQHRLPDKDWLLKQHIEEVLHQYPSYGHKRLALHLCINKKRVRRVMRIFGIKPYRRRGKKYRKTKDNGVSYPNLLLTNIPRYPHHVWTSDFTHLSFHGKTIYVATVMDVFGREVVGYSILTTHATQLVTQALLSAIHNYPIPAILHSDQGSEYTSLDYLMLVDTLGIQPSMSRKASPWENGYQESFYDKFKIDLGDPNRFESLGELVAAIAETMYRYNHSRIHTILKMPPAIFAQRHSQRSNMILEGVS